MFGHRLLLVYAQSGAGKTSLFNAKIAPTLEAQDFDFLPPTRVWGLIPEGVDPRAIENFYMFHALQGFQQEDAKIQSSQQEKADLAALSNKSLATFLQERPRATDAEGRPTPRAIIFDQFEELFTFYPVHWQEQQDEFFRQITEALENDPLLRVALVIREDYLAQLDPFARLLPERLRIRFRIERLRKDAAQQAIEKPLAELDTGISFTPQAVEYLVGQLLRMKALGPTRKVVEVEGPYVEPVQLQVVCSRIWDSLRRGERRITRDHVVRSGDVDQALSDFYDREVRRVVQETGRRAHPTTGELQLRTWFEEELITPQGTRGTVFQGPQETAGIPNPLVRALEDIHLVRSETRAGAQWYELTHDRFIEPILESNRNWRKRRKMMRRALLVIANVVAIVALAVIVWYRFFSWYRFPF
jgi:hypothetical protein